MTGTKALAVKSLIKTWASAQTKVATDAIQVTYGYPSGSPEKRWINVGAINWQRSEWVTNRSREESFTVTLVFNVQMGAGTSEDAEAYVLAMATEFEATLKGDPNMGGLAVVTDFRPAKLNSYPISTGSEAQYETKVSATCRM